MALSELAALEAAYQVLHELDASGRRRALQWLADALGTQAPLAAALAEAADPMEAPPSASPVKGRTGSRHAATPAAGRPGGTRGKTASAAPAARARRSRRAEPEPAVASSSGRAYRRMPPAEEVLGAYEEIGSVAGLADHFGVPRHTVQGWARQLRRQGYTIGRTR
jgi:hypothetical protein